MSISGVNSPINAYASQWASRPHQRQQDFKAVAQSLQSGDLAGARKAFATFQQDAPQGMNTLPVGGQNLAALQNTGVGGLDQNFTALLQQMQAGQTGQGSQGTNPQSLAANLLQPSSQDHSSDPMSLFQALSPSAMINLQNVVGGTDQQQTANATNGNNAADSRRQQFQELEQALASGNLTAAQQVVTNIQQSATNGQNGQNPASTINRDIQAVRTALDADDITGAKGAMATMAKNMHGARQAYRHHSHGHLGGSGNNSTAAGGNAQGTPPANVSTIA